MSNVDPRIPEKSFFRIGEVAALADVETYVLRFWETEFPSLVPTKSRTNQRRYSRDDVGLVLRIRDLLYEDGFTIEGARKQLMNPQLSTRAEVPARTQKVIAQASAQLRELIQFVENA